MPRNLLRCEGCYGTIPPSAVNAGAPHTCARCDTATMLDVFPAALEGHDSTQPGVAPVMGEEAGCYTHPERRAVTSCENCGQFLCTTCSVPILDQHYCAPCLRALENRPPAATPLSGEYFRWESLSFLLTLVSLLVSLFAVFLLPAAMVFSFKAWRAPGGPLGRLRLKVGILILCQILIAILYISALVFVILGSMGVWD